MIYIYIYLYPDLIYLEARSSPLGLGDREIFISEYFTEIISGTYIGTERDREYLWSYCTGKEIISGGTYMALCGDTDYL